MAAGGNTSNNLVTGLFRRLIDLALQDDLLALDAAGLAAAVEEVDVAELPQRIGELASTWVAKALADVHEDDRPAAAQQLATELMASINRTAADPLLAQGETLASPISELTAIEALDPTGNIIPIKRPLTPIGDTVLLTNARGEPTLSKEIEAEIDSADRIDIVLAFIRWTGIRNLITALQKHLDAGKRVRVITTTYTGSTEAKALDKLQDLGVEVKVSYDTTTTRLHAKAWLFHRETGQSTVYIGSSNLTHSAQVTGMEWNVRASEVLNPDVVRSFESTFETYWQVDHFEPYDATQFNEALRRTVQDQTTDLTPFDITPYPFQKAILEQLQVERQRGRPHSLVVAATGTGKTVMAALDYRHLRTQLDSAKLLFIAHRKEILRQSRTTFRHVLRNGSFGEEWVDGQTPSEWTHVFASIQSLAANGLDNLAPDHFDVVIVDEFHHAAAATYTQVLDHLKPQHLIGLTATPERTDGLDITRWFGDRMAIELRLWDALEQQLLAPFHYFGIADGTDLSRVSWSGGKYSTTELTNVYTGDDMWVAKVLTAVGDVVADPHAMRALGFCVSIDHAEFMARKFAAAGFAAKAITSRTSSEERRNALQDLRDGKLAILFTVDLFNEGVDVPAMDTVLMLRPTESATIFLQQLGRGLRKHDGKSVLTVLDFVGQQRKEFRFDQRFSRLLGRTRRQIENDVQHGFPFLPAGCEITLDRESQEIVLASIKNAMPATFNKRVDELRSLGDISLATFLHEANLDLTDLYSSKHYWTSTRRAARFVSTEAAADEAAIGRGIGRMLHLDDLDRINFLRDTFLGDTPRTTAHMVQAERARLTMAMMTLLRPRKGHYPTLDDALAHVWQYPELRAEITELLDVLGERVTHLHTPADIHANVPLQVHATYAREEVMAALGPSTIDAPVLPQGGVYWHEPTQTDVFFVTLDKSSKDFSPTTRYHDYAISDTLFHWESQSVTRAASTTGQRYINQRMAGTNIALFVRRSPKTPDGRTRPYFFAGPADYVSHRGERPIGFTWELRNSLPGDTFADFRAAVA